MKMGIYWASCFQQTETKKHRGTLHLEKWSLQRAKAGTKCALFKPKGPKPSNHLEGTYSNTMIQYTWPEMGRDRIRVFLLAQPWCKSYVKIIQVFERFRDGHLNPHKQEWEIWKSWEYRKAWQILKPWCIGACTDRFIRTFQPMID